MSSIQIRVTGRYSIAKKIYEGPYSTVYVGKNSQSQQEVAIKCESKKSKHKFLIN
jgi:serine/threonine protein kinase